ncbi:hypothetical protein ACFXDE_02180 [Kitasatospora sp. NPDC059408]|uniref:hypothetical protein n=1 Tax=Kitasatospora sp. NPDC059408 TaxID=3346823 RepID=UPI0036C034F4
MPLYPRPLEQRFPAELQSIQLRLGRVETRTSAIDSGWPLAVLPAVIDPAYTSGQPRAFVNGATTLTGPYQRLASYTPAANDSVLVLPVRSTRTYVILGKLV